MFKIGFNFYNNWVFFFVEKRTRGIYNVASVISNKTFLAADIFAHIIRYIASVLEKDWLKISLRIFLVFSEKVLRYLDAIVT